MNYCKKCMRILEEDSKTCPYCGNLEEDEPLKTEYINPNANLTSMEEELTKLDVTENNNMPAQQEIVDDYISKQVEQLYKDSTTFKDFNPGLSKAPEVIISDEPMSSSLKIILILLLLFLSFFTIGLASIGAIVVGIYLIRHSNSHYRAFGKLYLILSIVILAIFILIIVAGVLIFINFAFAY